MHCIRCNIFYVFLQTIFYVLYSMHSFFCRTLKGAVINNSFQKKTVTNTHILPDFKCSVLPTAAMAGQLNSFVKKFNSLWQAGNNARLNIECHAGNAQIHLQLNFIVNQTFNHIASLATRPDTSLNILLNIPTVTKDPLASVAAPDVS
jgi:hypothetical protein